MSIQLADLQSRMTEPQTILMAKLGRALKAKGIDVVDLSLGEPDFATPQHIIDAAKKSLDEGFTKYPPVAGIPALRDAIVKKLQRDNQLSYTSDQIVVSTGAKQSLYNAVLSIINKGDEAIIPTPFWVTYASQVTMAEGKPVFVSCGIEQDFKISASQLEAAITPKTKLFIFSSPCNPSGAVYTKQELSALKDVFVKYPQIAIISDEIYEYINYEGKHQSIAQFEELKDRVIIVNGMSKGFSMTGWRIGYIAAPIEIAKACEKLQSQVTSGANITAQYASVAALTGDLTPSFKMVEAFKERRDYFVNALAAIEGFNINLPHGAFYAFADISSFFGTKNNQDEVNNADEFAMYLLNTAHVNCVTGNAFGAPNCIRFSFATSMDNLKEAAKRIQIACSLLK